jgi:hypothetical protein
LVHKHGLKGGLFWTIKAIFLIEDKKRKKTYSRILKAGGGMVVKTWKSLEGLASQPPGVRELTHVFLDPCPKIRNSPYFQPSHLQLLGFWSRSSFFSYLLLRR